MAMKLSSEYARTYFDPKVFKKWEKRFGIEFKLMVDAICINNLLNNHHTPVCLVFRGNPSRMPNGTQLKFSAPLQTVKGRNTILSKFLGKAPIERQIIYVFYGQAA